MKKILVIAAYFWAITCLLLIPCTFMFNYPLAGVFAKLPFMKVNPVFTGGEVSRMIKEDGIKTYIYKPVFESLIGESSKGFVQVKFSSNGKLPESIDKTIDYDNDGNPDFRIIVNTITNKTELKSITPDILGLKVSSRVKGYWIVRVSLKNKSTH